MKRTKGEINVQAQWDCLSPMHTTHLQWRPQISLLWTVKMSPVHILSNTLVYKKLEGKVEWKKACRDFFFTSTNLTFLRCSGLCELWFHGAEFWSKTRPWFDRRLLSLVLAGERSLLSTFCMPALIFHWSFVTFHSLTQTSASTERS